MVELATRWDQSSIDPTTRKLAQEKTAQLEIDGRSVREGSLGGLVRRREEGEGSAGNTRSGAVRVTKRQKNSAGKSVESVLDDFAEGISEDKEKLRELEVKQDQKDQDLMRGILELTNEIREESERRSHHAYLEREAGKDELAMILEALRKGGKI